MKEAALFYEDFLLEGPDGKYLFSPSYSPENNPNNSPSQTCINATMDIAVAQELLRNLIAACEALNTEPQDVARWKKMRDAQMSCDVVDWLADNYWSPNMVTTHNPKSLFNTDLCGGLPAIIIKMLVDSQPGWIELLPALPKEWPTGRIEGIRCRGQIEVRSLVWDGKRITVTLRSSPAQKTRIKLAVRIASLEVKQGPRSAIGSTVGGDGQVVHLPAGRDVTFTIIRK